MTHPEITIAEWLLDNKQHLLEMIDLRKQERSLYSKEFKDVYEDNILDIIKRELEHSIPINPEELELFLTKDFVIMLLNKEVFN